MVEDNDTNRSNDFISSKTFEVYAFSSNFDCHFQIIYKL